MFKKLILATLVLNLTVLFSCAGENGGGTETQQETAAETQPQITQYLPESPEDAVLPSDGVYIVYAVNSSSAGVIEGDVSQDVSGGGLSSKVNAKANLGYKFVKWSDGSVEASRSGDTAESSTVITAIFDYDILELPLVLINTETGGDVKSKTEYINADISMFENGSVSSFWTAEIRGRGNNTWGYPKKSYKIKFTDKQQPFGLGSGDGRVWVMLANQCDQSLLRNHFAFELAKSFDKIDFASSSTSVEVFLNGEYRGVYLLAEEIRVGGDRVDVDDSLTGVDTGYLVELSAYSNGDWIFRVGSRQYQVRSELSTNPELAEQQFNYIKDYMNSCFEAVSNGDREQIEKLIDLDSYIDTYLVEEITKNLDLGWDSYYLHKDKGGKLVLGPLWDFDLSFGNSNEGCQYYTDIYAGIDSRNGLGNPWYTEASKLDWFRELVVQRWDEVYENIVSKLPEKILAEGQRGFNSYSRNFLKWQIFGTSQNRETEFITRLKNYKEHYEYFSEWVQNRIDWLNDYYHTVEYKNGDFINNGNSGGWSGGAPEKDVYGNDATKQLMEKYKSFDGTMKLDGADAPGFENEGPENLFDGLASTKYCYNLDYGNENDIIFTASKSFTAKAYVLRTANDTDMYSERNPDEWVLYGRDSKDGEWIKIDSVKNGESQLGAVNYTCYGFKIDNPASYKYYRLWVKNEGVMQISDFILLG